MQKIVSSTRLYYFAIFVATCATTLYIIQKTDVLAPARLFMHTAPLYAFWLLSIFFLAYTSFLHTRQKMSDKIWQFLIGWFPSATLLCITPFITITHIHPYITAIVGFHIIAIGLVWIIAYHKKNSTSHQKTEIHFSHVQIIALVVIFGVYMFMGIQDLGRAFYVDEKLWIYDRIETYWDNLFDGDLLNTRPSDKPGITTALASGPGLLFFDPSDFMEGTVHKDQLEHLFFALRLPAFLVITACLFLALVLLRKIFTPTTTILIMLFLCFSPLLLGIARMINPDALLWIFFLISFLAFIHYLFHASLPSLYCAGIFLGLSLLTKYIANIFFVFYFLVIFLDPVVRHTAYTHIAQRLRMRLTHVSIMIGIALSIFYILYPGAWVRHDRILLATIHSEAFASTWIYFALFVSLVFIDLFLYRAKYTSYVIRLCIPYADWIIRGFMLIFAFGILFVLYNVYTQMSIFDFSSMIESPKSVYRDVGTLALFSASFYPLIFGITPLVLIGVIYAVYHTLHSKKFIDHHMIVLYSVIFIIMYYVGSIVNNVMPIIRYQIVLYPLMILIASIGWMLLFQRFVLNTRVITAICIVFFICESTQLFFLHTYYFSYNSPLLPQKYIINSKDMGDGNYEIAQFLNAKPHAQDLLVWTDKTGLCQFFVGSCNNMIQDLSLVDIAPQIDYFVISQNRQEYITRLSAQKRLNNSSYPLALDRLYDPHNTRVFELLPGSRTAQFIRVIPADTVNIIAH